MPRVLVIGARRQRQGIGEFVARWFAAAGAEVCAVVGTSEQTAAAARATLGERYGIEARAYTSVETALEQERPDIAAICSPFRFHRQQLERVAAAGVHCLCEKPLWWEDAADRRAETQRLVDDFTRRGLLLDLVTQWPCTLEGYRTLCAEAVSAPVARFAMQLSPGSTGARMIPDAAPHPVSMLHGLVGSGRVESAVAQWSSGDRDDLSLDFLWRHAAGAVEVSCRFRVCPEPPRPAAYAVNGHWAHRRLRLPDYEIRLEADPGSVVLEDPLQVLVRDFLARVASGSAETDAGRLVEGVAALEALAEAESRAAQALGGAVRPPDDAASTRGDS